MRGLFVSSTRLTALTDERGITTLPSLPTEAITLEAMLRELKH